MKSITNERISKAARRYLEARDLEVIDEFEHDGTPFVVAEDAGEIAIARVSFGFDRVPDPWRDRDAFEEVAAMYLKGHDAVDVPVRGDSVDILVLAESRALLRHTINCMGSFCEA